MTPNRQQSTWRRLLVPAVVVIVAFAAWVLLAPPLLGGSTSYAITVGTSMEPRFHTGDLILVREADTYRIGDVVAYRSAKLGAIVLHRVVATERDRYVLKGDNNSWLDAERPARGELVGKLWLHVPAAGRFLAFRSPHSIALLTGAATLLLLGGAGAGAATKQA